MIEVKRGKRKEEGTCNACQSREDDRVIVVSLKTASIRLCPSCAAELHGALGAVLPAGDLTSLPRDECGADPPGAAIPLSGGEILILRDECDGADR